MTAPPTGPLHGVLTHPDVVVCGGTGGVGKTTTAAAFALAAARMGRRVVVVTVDPARRLADALGLDGIGNECTQVRGVGPGDLWVTMLDTKATFDGLIRRHAIDDDQADRILANRYYRNLSATLSGTREFMATERLYELHRDERFDLVVVDTPPSRNALDFLDAPDRLGRFLDGRLFRFAVPGSGVRRVVTAPLLLFLRRIARVVSPQVVDDTLAFIEAFAGMEEGFRARAKAVDEVLTAESTAFVLVSTATAEAVDESIYLADRLHEMGRGVDALVCNRLQPTFTEVPIDEIEDAIAAAPAAAARQLSVLRDVQVLGEAERAQLEPLEQRCEGAAVARLPQLDHDVHDLEGIEEIVAQLLGGEPD